MPTTTNLSLPYPQASDSVDVPRDVQALANAVDTALIPTLSQYSHRNKIINGDFSVNQRVFSSGAVSGYGFDRWRFEAVGGTVTHSSQAFTLGNAIAGYESANYARLVVTGQSAAGDYAVLQQRIESVRTLAGQTATLSFWAKANSGTPKIAVEWVQNFGTGGSPSANITTYAGQVTLSTTMTRYTVTVAVPSISGKTLGTDNNDYLALNLWVSAGSSFNSRTGTIGVQNSTFDIWGVQFEKGSVATPFEIRPQQVELALCQRYYQKSYRYATAPGSIASGSGDSVIFAGWGTASSAKLFFAEHRVTMRAAPILSYWDYNGNASRITTYDAGFTATHNVVATGGSGTGPDRHYVAPGTSTVNGWTWAYALDAEL